MKFIELLIANRFTVTAVILFVIGLLNMMLQQNLIKKIIGFDVMDSAVFLMLTSQGYIEGRTAAILTDYGANVSQYTNPIPTGLVLTGIVVSVSVSAFSLALTQRLYKKYGTVNMKELLLLIKKNEEEEKQ